MPLSTVRSEYNRPALAMAPVSMVNANAIDHGFSIYGGCECKRAAQNRVNFDRRDDRLDSMKELHFHAKFLYHENVLQQGD